jgi:gamma-glutamyltranspeptidase / glutathione hydrolase
VSPVGDAARIASAGALSSAAEGPGDTTHLTVADGNGNVVSLTQSIQSAFGAKIASRNLGFVYNNYLCTCARTAQPYALGPRCRPRSNAAPLMVLASRELSSPPLLALGAAGSRRILSSMLQVLSRIIDLGWDLADAVAAPRIHALLSRKLWIERPAASEALLQRLSSRFAEIRIRPRHSYAMGAVHALRFAAGAIIAAAADPRRDGNAKLENVHD